MEGRAPKRGQPRGSPRFHAHRPRSRSGQPIPGRRAPGSPRARHPRAREIAARRRRPRGLRNVAVRVRIPLTFGAAPMQSVRNRNQPKSIVQPGDPVTAKATNVPDGVFARERQEQIARMVEENGRARVTDLAGSFGVSAVTIRKDLLVLEGKLRVIRTHGGAITPGEHRTELAFEIRERLQREEKAGIGAAAADRVSDGESIVLDASTTALYIARHLKDREAWHGLTVITNSIRIASELAGHPGMTVLMLGGRVRWEALSVVGPLGDAVFRRVNVQKAFVGAAGFTIEAGLSDVMEEEAQIKRSMVAAAREVYAVVDHTKWGRVALATFCRTDRLTGVFTDGEAPATMVATLRDMGIQVTELGQPGPVDVAGRSSEVSR